MSFWKRLFRQEEPSSAPADKAAEMQPLDFLMGELLETWEQRYTFALNREKRELSLRVTGFELLATETEAGKIALTFEEAGKKHRVECLPTEAPRLVEALLFPESEKD